MAEESKSKASQVASEVAPTEQNSTTINDQGQVQDFGPDQEPGQYQGQFGGQGGKKCMCNPCKFCCGGNLRSACFAISITEFVFLAGVLINLIRTAVALSQVKVYKHDPNWEKRKRETDDVDNTSTITSHTYGIAISTVLAILLLGASISLLLAVIKRFKWACLIHAVCTSMLSFLYVLVVIMCIVVFALLDTILPELCEAFKSDSKPNAVVITPGPRNTSGECGLKTLLIIFISFLLILSLIFGTLWAYFASNSIALYCHYKNGVTYEGTSLCICGRGGRQMQPQYQYVYHYQDPGQNPNEYQYDQSQSQNEMQPQETAPSFK